MYEIKRAIIIAAGMGTRLRPVTDTTPKPLVSINGVRLIDSSIQALKTNGIHEIYIVVGYKKEQFEKIYAEDKDIHIIINPYYLDGNNITSLYLAREYLPNSFVIEGDLMIKNPTILDPYIEKSGYCGSLFPVSTEWAMKVENGRITSCTKQGVPGTWRTYGISMWTEDDGKHLAALIQKQFEKKKDWSVYWDEIPLIMYLQHFNLGVRKIDPSDVFEIDIIDELIDIDPSYKSFMQ